MATFLKYRVGVPVDPTQTGPWRSTCDLAKAVGREMGFDQPCSLEAHGFVQSDSRSYFTTILEADLQLV